VTPEQFVAIAFLCMSALSLLWQGTALTSLVRDSSLRSRATVAYGGLLRTAACRVGVAVAYVLVGINALWPRVEVLLLTFGVFCGTQALWQLNAWADLRLARRLKTARQEPGPVGAEAPADATGRSTR
jgi:hypothetical protein